MGRSRSDLSKAETFCCLGLVLLLFAEQLMFGGGNTSVSLIFVSLYAIVLSLCLAKRPLFRTLSRARDLGLPALAFMGVFLAAFWALTPYVPGGPHPIWAYVGVGGAATLDRSAALIQLVQLAGAGCCFLLGYLIGARDSRAVLFLKILILGGGLYAAWAFFAFLLDPGSTFGLPKRVHMMRLTGSFVSANTTGALLATLAVLALTWLLSGLRTALNLEQVMSRIAAPLIAVLIIGTSLLLTASRGALTACAVSVLLLLAWQFLSGHSRFSAALALLAAGIAAAALLISMRSGTLVATRAAEVGGDVTERWSLFSTHWRAFLASPWNGYGLGSFHKVNQLNLTSSTYVSSWDIRAAHNVYLQWLEEAGVFGALPMFLCIAVILGQIVAGSLSRERMAVWLKGLTACSLVLLLHGMTDYALQLPSIQALWAVLLGLGCAVASKRHPATASTRTPVPAGGTVKAGLILAGAILTTMSAVSFGIALYAPSSAVAAALPLAEPSGREADRLLAAQDGDRASRLAQAGVLTMKELRLSPASGAAWVRLAQIESERSGGFTAPAAAALERSYTVAPLDPYLIPARLPYVYSYWGELTPDMRADTLSQIELAWRVPGQQQALLRAGSSIPGEGGRLAYAMKLSSLITLGRLEARLEARRAVQLHPER
jgi:O-antigen ligase